MLRECDRSGREYQSQLSIWFLYTREHKTPGFKNRYRQASYVHAQASASPLALSFPSYAQLNLKLHVCFTRHEVIIANPICPGDSDNNSKLESANPIGGLSGTQLLSLRLTFLLPQFRKPQNPQKRDSTLSFAETELTDRV